MLKNIEVRVITGVLFTNLRRLRICLANNLKSQIHLPPTVAVKIFVAEPSFVIAQSFLSCHLSVLFGG